MTFTSAEIDRAVECVNEPEYRIPQGRAEAVTGSLSVQQLGYATVSRLPREWQTFEMLMLVLGCIGAGIEIGLELVRNKEKVR